MNGYITLAVALLQNAESLYRAGQECDGEEQLVEAISLLRQAGRNDLADYHFEQRMNGCPEWTN